MNAADTLTGVAIGAGIVLILGAIFLYRLLRNMWP